MVALLLDPDGVIYEGDAEVAGSAEALEYAAGVEATVMGKPAAPFFETALLLLGVTPANAFMVGDDMRGDIEGAASGGLRTELVRRGKFRAGDLDQGITPSTVIDSIADLPAWWQDNVDTQAKR